MSEKATLLTSIPPVSKSDGKKKPDLLTSTPAVRDLSSVQSSEETQEEVKPSVINQPSNTTQPEQPVTVVKAEVETESVQVVVSDSAGEAASVSTFQAITFGSFVLVLCMAAVAALVLFRKASKVVEERFVNGTRALGGMSLLVALNSAFVTYLFSGFLKGDSPHAPVSLTLAIWVLAGPLVGITLNYLLTPGKRPEMGRMVTDSVIYAVIFGLVAASVFPGIKANAALLFAIAAAFLFIVPVARLFSLFRTAKARHPELGEMSDQVLIYSLILGPGLLPVVACAHVFGAAGEGSMISQFLTNFIVFDTLLVATLAMVASADEFDPHAEKSPEADEAESAPTATQVQTAPTAAPSTTPVEAPQPVPAAASKRLAPKKLPARKPVTASVDKPRPSAPQRPNPSSASSSGKLAPNAPSKLKAPSKPKKRF